MAFEVSDLNACVQKMKERAVSFIAEAFNAPCRMAMGDAAILRRYPIEVRKELEANKGMRHS